MLTLLLVPGSLAGPGSAAVSGPLVLDDPLLAPLVHAEPQSDDRRYRIRATMRVGDLDADGRDDLLLCEWDVRWADTGVGLDGRLVATAVSEGRRLWRVTRTITKGFPRYPIAARVGPRGRSGVVLLTDTNQNGYALTAAAVDSRGDVAWERTFASTYSYDVPTFAAAGVPAMFEPVDALDGAATDFLVGVLDYADIAASRLVTQMVDGRDGTLVPLGQEVSAGAFPDLAVAGDADADDKPDYAAVVHRPGTGATVTARSGDDGEEIWSRSGLAAEPPDLYVDAVGDMTRDGIPELAVTAPPTDDRNAFHVVDGGTGDPMWEGQGNFAFALGDADGDRRGDLGTKSGWFAEDRIGEEFFAYGAAGDELYHRRVSRPRGCRACFVLILLLDAGDIDADGVADTFVDRYVFEDGRVRRYRYHLSGRRGEMLFDGVPVSPVGASLDGRGVDLVSLRPRSRGRLAVTAIDGRGGLPLWRSELRGRPVGAYEPYLASARLDGDGTPDVFVTLERGGAVSVVALDGRDGSRLWTYRDRTAAL
ncbi:MAG TPA: PQQ-binding-like beta-propeller repeat protein [Actinomycetota bacterium]|nr:PQQ-binding-like beta-propeller repeat protein [Actinomycetota bacterium]